MKLKAGGTRASLPHLDETDADAMLKPYAARKVYDQIASTTISGLDEYFSKEVKG